MDGSVLWFGGGEACRGSTSSCLLKMFARWQHKDGFHGLSRSLSCNGRGQPQLVGHSWQDQVTNPVNLDKLGLYKSKRRDRKAQQHRPTLLSCSLKLAQLIVFLKPDWGSSQCLYINILIYCTVISPSQKAWCLFISVWEHPDRSSTCLTYFSQLSFISHVDKPWAAEKYFWNNWNDSGRGFSQDSRYAVSIWTFLFTQSKCTDWDKNQINVLINAWRSIQTHPLTGHRSQRT